MNLKLDFFSICEHCEPCTHILNYRNTLHREEKPKIIQVQKIFDLIDLIKDFVSRSKIRFFWFNFFKEAVFSRKINAEYCYDECDYEYVQIHEKTFIINATFRLIAVLDFFNFRKQRRSFLLPCIVVG